MSADGSNQTRLTFNQAGDFAPAWSPNGRQIVFSSFRDDEHLADIDLDEHNAEIYVMDADGSNQGKEKDNKVEIMRVTWI